RHTELVTVYVPSGYNINKVADQINNEKSTASNIKSKSTKNNVVDALDKILGHLKAYRETPKNGLAIFCGNISKFEGAADIELWGFEPPEPVTIRLYRCDQTFILDPLQDIFREKEIYGFILVDTQDGDVGVLKGKKIQSLKHLDSIVPGKTSKGGWSQARYARVREGLLHDFLKMVGEAATGKFREMKDLKGVIVAGPGPVKDEFLKGEFLGSDIKEKVLGTVDTSYTGEQGFREALNRAEDILKEASVVRERKIVERFFTELSKSTGLVVYGLKQTIESLKSGLIEMLLVSEDMDWVKVDYSCSKCGELSEKIVERNLIENQACHKCEVKLAVKSQEDLVEKILEMAEKMSTKVETISSETAEGEQFKSLGGIGGILRYRSQ
ncbi:MAG: peptide chain release factor aRF-1, partial [Candidatus Aenigmarchaeota archaeon]|nr:peptide chain release factor aRF-1 [Candidatus Aenigmarchaeota archaeon]